MKSCSPESWEGIRMNRSVQGSNVMLWENIRLLVKTINPHLNFLKLANLLYISSWFHNESYCNCSIVLSLIVKTLIRPNYWSATDDTLISFWYQHPCDQTNTCKIHELVTGNIELSLISISVYSKASLIRTPVMEPIRISYYKVIHLYTKVSRSICLYFLYWV